MMSPAKKSAAPPKDKQAELMAAALQLFTQKGYAASSVREIVARAGVTKPVLYYYFRNKEDLYLALIKRFVARIDALLKDAPAHGGSWKSHLLDFFDRTFLVIFEHINDFRLMHAIYYGPPQGAPYFDFDAYHAKYHGRVMLMVESGIAAGEFRPGDAGDMAWALMGACQVALEEQLFAEAARIDRKKLRKILNVIFEGISAPEQLR
jgi:TetR/AcrR family transcriptional regulator